MTDPIRRAAQLLRQADGLLIAAGAGMGVDSGLPDFRGAQGFWQAYPALGRARLAFEEIASPAAFQAHPRLAWGFYGHRLALYRRTRPHAGFEILRRWADAAGAGGSVFTSNVDGQFQAAGFAADQVHECHGSIHHLQCTTACGAGIWPAEGFTPEVDEARCLLLNDPPRCPRCGALARPNVLMFGDWGWLPDRQVAQEARQDDWLQSVRRPLVVELGAGSAIPSMRQFSLRVLRRHGGHLVRINPREHAVGRTEDVAIAMAALPALLAIGAERGGS